MTRLVGSDRVVGKPRIWLAAAVISALLVVTPPSCAQVQSKVDGLFAQYPASPLFHGKRARPNLNDAAARMFRTRLRYAAAKGPLFAGHYAMAIWGCGASCISFTVIDLISGKVTSFPATVSQSNEKGERLTFRPDSRAIHVVGSLNEGDSVDSWYLWTGSRFRLIQTKPPQLLDDEGNDLKSESATPPQP
jgi:hypothetical protein